MEDLNSNTNNLFNRESTKKVGKSFKNTALLIKFNSSVQEWNKSHLQVQLKRNVKEKERNLILSIKVMEIDMATVMNKSKKINKEELKELQTEWLKDLEVLKSNTNSLYSKDLIKKDGKSWNNIALLIIFNLNAAENFKNRVLHLLLQAPAQKKRNAEERTENLIPKEKDMAIMDMVTSTGMDMDMDTVMDTVMDMVMVINIIKKILILTEN